VSYRKGQLFGKRPSLCGSDEGCPDALQGIGSLLEYSGKVKRKSCPLVTTNQNGGGLKRRDVRASVAEWGQRLRTLDTSLREGGKIRENREKRFSLAWGKRLKSQ